MGFDTYITIGERNSHMWRKSTGDLPRLLFRYDQAFMEQVDENAGDHPEPSLAVGFRATASEVLETLEIAGLGWEATLAAYASIRQGLVAESQIYVEESMRKVDPEFSVEQRISEFRAKPAGYDLEALGRLLAAQWLDADCEEVLLFEEVTHHHHIEVSAGYLFDVIYAAKDAGVDYLAVGRAVESWALLYRDAPLLAGPILMCILLRHLPPALQVSYVLTEDASENDISTIAQAEPYVEDYWRDSAEGLASHAGVLGRLFSVLAAFDSKLGRDFWFACSADAFGRLERIRAEKELHSTKARGDALESAMDALLRTEEPELEIVEKNFRTSEEEIDILLSNGLSHPFWASMSSPVIMVECKNWSTRVGVKELRVLESKMQDRAAITRIGIFVSMSGYTRPFLERLKTIQGNGGIIFAVTGDDLRKLVASKTRLSEWLRKEGLLRGFGK